MCENSGNNIISVKKTLWVYTATRKKKINEIKWANKWWKSGCQKVHKLWKVEVVLDRYGAIKKTIENDSMTNTHRQSNHYDNGFSGNI